MCVLCAAAKSLLKITPEVMIKDWDKTKKRAKVSMTHAVCPSFALGPTQRTAALTMQCTS